MLNERNTARKFKGEKIIRLKNVPTLPDMFLERPSYDKVVRWYKRGIWVDGEQVKLRGRREGRVILTSVQAVEQFLEVLNREGR